MNGGIIMSMNTLTVKDLKTTANNLQALIKIAKKQLLLMRIQEAEANFTAGNFKVLKNAKDLAK